MPHDDDDEDEDEGTDDGGALEAPAAAAGGGWELLEKLAAVIVAAETLRLVGSVIAGIVYSASTHAGATLPGAVVAGNALQTAAGFADGPGVVLLLVSVGLVWWRAAYWRERLDRSLAHRGADGAEPVEAVQLRRLDRLAGLVGAILALAAAGALVFLVGIFLLNTVHGEPAAARAEAFADGTFPLAYAVIATAGALAARHLAGQCRTALALLRPTA